MQAKTRLVLMLMFLFAVVATEASSQTLPAKIKSHLDKNYPGWRYPAPPMRQSPCAAELRKAVVSGHFNSDRNLDYAVRFVRGRNGYVVAFIAQGDNYKAHLLERPSASEMRNLILDVGRKGDEYVVDGDLENTAPLPSDAPYTVPCESDAFAYYVYRNGRFG